MPARRVPEIDAIRVIGISAVIFGHVYSVPFVYQWIYPWHVPLFFFLTGYLWKPGRRLLKELQARVKTLAIPYFAWFAVVSLAFLCYVATSVPPDLASLRGPLWGGAMATGPFGTLWFVSVLFFATVLYRLIERLPFALQWALALTGLTAVYWNGSMLASTPFGIALALPCLVFVLAGRLLRRLQSRVSRPGLVGSTFFLVAGFAMAITPFPAFDMKGGQFGIPVISVLVAVLMSAGVILLTSKVSLGPWLSRWASRLASVGIAVVLSHPFLVWALRTEGAQPKWILLASVIMPWCLALFLVRMRILSTLLIGIRAPKAHGGRVLTRAESVTDAVPENN